MQLSLVACAPFVAAAAPFVTDAARHALAGAENRRIGQFPGAVTRSHMIRTTPLTLPVGRRPRVRGFTMIELMVTVAVAAILLALAAPAMRNVISQRATVAQASELAEAMRFARSEAMKRSSPVTVCKVASAGGTTCASDSGVTWQYWLVFAELTGGANKPCQFDAGEPSLRKQSASSTNAQWQPSDPTDFACITFQSTGIAIPDHWSTTKSGAASALSVMVVPNMPPSAAVKRYSRRICVNAQGRVETVDGLTDCP